MKSNKKVQQILLKATSCAFLLMFAASNVQADQYDSYHCSDIPGSTPDSRFLVMENSSEVKDKITGLIWQRCILGQKWNGTSCLKTPPVFNWKNALEEAQKLGSGYRLPNVKELDSIVEIQCYEPAINLNIFPNTPSPTNEGFWSSSPSIHNASYSFYVDFERGFVKTSKKNRKRLIRAVRSE